MAYIVTRLLLKFYNRQFGSCLAIVKIEIAANAKQLSADIKALR